MDMKPLVSIIIPVYNDSVYLVNCIDSVLNQSYQDLDILLIDDGSTDGSGDLCDRYARKDSRVRVIHQKNEGVAEARNIGIREADGEYIGFVDSDDVIHQDMFARLINVAEDSRADLVFCDFVRFFTDTPDGFSDCQPETAGVEISKEQAFISLSKLDAGYYIWKGLYKKELARKYLFWKGKQGEDIYWLPRIMDTAERIVWLHQVLYAYRIRTDSIVHSGFSISKIDFIRGRRAALILAEKKYPEAGCALAADLYSQCMTRYLQIPELKDGNERSQCYREIAKSIRHMKKYSVRQIWRDPSIDKQRKICTVIGKLSFPLACRSKQLLLWLFNR